MRAWLPSLAVCVTLVAAPPAEASPKLTIKQARAYARDVALPRLLRKDGDVWTKKWIAGCERWDRQHVSCHFGAHGHARGDKTERFACAGDILVWRRPSGRLRSRNYAADCS